MKKLLTLAFIVIAMVFTTNVNAQDFSGLDKSPADISAYPARGAEKSVRVIYSRPQLKGRSLSDLTPAGEVWRTGANEATEITFYKDVTFGGKAVKAGTYALFSIPNAGEWTIILNSSLNQWGAYSYADTADIVRVPATVTEASESLEAFSIAYKEVEDGVTMVLGWGTTRVSVPVTL